MTFYTLLRLTLLVAGASAICPIGAIRGPTRLSCYQLYTKRMMWLDAEGQCRKGSGHLASIPSSLTNAFLQKFINSTNPTEALLDQYWAGGWETAGKWSWIDNSRWSFTKWGKGQPTERKAYFNYYSTCLALNGTDGTWYNNPCTEHYPFFCSVPDSASTGCGAPPPPNVPTPPPAKPCPAGWTFFPETDLCYGVVNGSSGYSSNEAADLCAKNNAVLPSITDPNMNFRLMSFVIDAQTGNEYANIGLRYNATEEQWQWMDGRAASFTYWKTGYPQNTDDAQCARMSFHAPQIGGWVNINCEFVEDTAVVCERQSGEYE